MQKVQKRRILVVFDGSHFPKAAMSFAANLNKTSPVQLTGVFLTSADYSHAFVYYFGGKTRPAYLPEMASRSAEMTAAAERFKTFCVKQGIDYRLDEETSINLLDALEKQSRYADLLIFSNNTDEDLTAFGGTFLDKVLHKIECPVLLAQESTAFPAEVCIAYDGRQSSVFALKQFAYLLPEFSQCKISIVNFSEEEEEFPDLEEIKSLAFAHFEHVVFIKTATEAAEYPETNLQDGSHNLWVTGAFGRSSLSEIFRKEFAQVFLNKNKGSLFIAHM